MASRNPDERIIDMERVSYRPQPTSIETHAPVSVRRIESPEAKPSGFWPWDHDGASDKHEQVVSDVDRFQLQLDHTFERGAHLEARFIQESGKYTNLLQAIVNDPGHVPAAQQVTHNMASESVANMDARKRLYVEFFDAEAMEILRRARR